MYPDGGIFGAGGSASSFYWGCLNFFCFLLELLIYRYTAYIFYTGLPLQNM